MDTVVRFLEVLNTNQVLLLHCRGMDNDNGTEAYMLLRQLVKLFVCYTQRIYLHCFTGDYYVFRQWNTTFPNLYIGLQASRGVRNDRLLFETDAPYFQLRGQAWSAPNQLYSVAECVAPHRGVTPKELLESTTSNAEKLFC